MLAYTEVTIDYAEDDLPTDIFSKIEEKKSLKLKKNYKILLKLVKDVKV